MAQFSDEALRQLAAHVEAESRRWVEQFIAGRRAFLRSRKIDASRALSDSFAYEVASVLEGQLRTELLLEFEEHGRLIDMKRLNVPKGGGDYLAALEDWIVRKGLQERFVRKFVATRRLKKAPDNVLRQMAWGIAVNRSQRYRRRSWYAKSKSAAVTDLFNRVASGLPDIVAEEIKKAFTQT